MSQASESINETLCIRVCNKCPATSGVIDCPKCFKPYTVGAVTIQKVAYVLAAIAYASNANCGAAPAKVSLSQEGGERTGFVELAAAVSQLNLKAYARARMMVALVSDAAHKKQEIVSCGSLMDEIWKFAGMLLPSADEDLESSRGNETVREILSRVTEAEEFLWANRAGINFLAKVLVALGELDSEDLGAAFNKA